MPKYGSKKYRQALTAPQQASAGYILPYLAKAIQQAEGDKTGQMGVRSFKATDPSQVLSNSIYNNFARWIESGQAGKFVDFMKKRWAPDNVANDPTHLNQNWAPNVRGSLLQQLGGTEYDRWRKYNMVQQSPNTAPGSYTV